VQIIDEPSGKREHRFLNGPQPDMVLVDELFTSTDDPDDILWLLQDSQNTVTDVATIGTTGQAQLRNQIEYHAFGEITSQTNSAYQPLQTYTGQIQDDATGLLYYDARWFDPSVNQFVNDDPDGFAAGDPNLRRYVGNSNPNATDPSGLVLVLNRDHAREKITKKSPLYKQLGTTPDRRRLLNELIASPKVDSFSSVDKLETYLSSTLTTGITLPKSIGPNTIQIAILTFIPQATVTSPYGVFSGDDRGLASEPFAIDQTYRTRQVIAFDPDDPTWGLHNPHAGETHLLDNGSVINKRRCTEGKEMRHTADVKGRNKDKGRLHIVRVTSSSRNPLIPKLGGPAIDYSFTFQVVEQRDGWTVTYIGRHDGFPAYEVFFRVGNGPWKPVFQWDPRDHNDGPFSLIGDGEHMYPNYRPPILVPRKNTNSSNVP
jgi:RHS repeat-associated protein